MPTASYDLAAATMSNAVMLAAARVDAGRGYSARVANVVANPVVVVVNVVTNTP